MSALKLSKDQLFIISEQNVRLKTISTSEPILDIGGGGEGVIGKLNGRNVTAIDTKLRELTDGGSEARRAVMDGTKLGFKDRSFSMVTLFFTLMYIKQMRRKSVFLEIERVIKPGGRLFIWDVVIPKPFVKAQKAYVVPLRINLPDRLINTAYGVLWQTHTQSIIETYRLARASEFELVRQYVYGDIFYFEFIKS